MSINLLSAEIEITRNHEELKQLLSLADFNVIKDKYRDGLGLELAIKRNDDVSVELLLAHGAIPDNNEPQPTWLKNILAEAIRIQNLKIIQLLFNQGCDPDTLLEIDDQQIVIPDTIPYNCWYEIVVLDNLPIFQFLLECKGRKITKDEWNQKILMLACASGSVRIVEYLLDQGLSIKITDEKNWTCLFYAVAYRQLPVIELLIFRGANLEHRCFNGRTLFHIFAFHHRMVDSPKSAHLHRVMLFLIDKGIDINAIDNNGLTPINAAFSVSDINEEFVSLIFFRDHNIDFSKPDIDGITVLHRVISTGYKVPSFDLTNDEFSDFNLYNDILIRLDVDINARDKKGRTPLQMINENSVEYLDLLLDMGADTEGLHHLEEHMFKNQRFLRILRRYQLKRSISGLSEDQNINNLIDQYGEFWKKNCDVNSLWNYSFEIEVMKKKILCDKLTFYDFLLAKKRTCIKVAKIPRMRKILLLWPTLPTSSFEFLLSINKFPLYAKMLAKKYLDGAQPLTPSESEAIISAEENLGIVFNSNLPNLVIHNIKKYIDIEDMITIKNVVI